MKSSKISFLKGLIIIGVFLSIPLGVFAQWNDCTHGRVDDACNYPGECDNYIDTNNDKICDHSQPKPVTKTEFVKENNTRVVALTVDDNVNDEDIFNNTESQKFIDNTNLETKKNEESIGDDNQLKGKGDLLETKKKTQRQKYPFLQIVIASVVLYLLTYLLARQKVIRMLTHKKIWNIFLTISFLAMAFTSIVLIVQINSGRVFLPGFDLIYWHVITGSVMLIITLFHMFWHWRYYTNLFK